MKLYDLKDAYQRLLDVEDSEAFAFGLAQIEDEIRVKAESIAAVIRILEGEAVPGAEVGVGQHLVIR